MISKFTSFLVSLFCICGITFAEDFSSPDFREHVTDTIYVIDKPDTVYLPIMQKKADSNSETIAEASSNDTTANAVAEVSSQKKDELPPPQILFCINVGSSANLILFVFKSLLIDFGLLFENSYRGAVVLNPTLYFEFGDTDFMSHEKEWDGFRLTTGIEVGYRQYLGTVIFNRKDTSKQRSRNVPNDAASIYIQGSVIPTFLYANDKKVDRDETYTSHFIPGIAVQALLGFQFNFGFLYDTNFGIGYQHWERDDRRIPINSRPDEANISLFNGSTPSGIFFKFNIAFEF